MANDPNNPSGDDATDLADTNWTEGGDAGTGALANGAQVGRYVVLDALGAGGMGAVYRAYDPRLDRRVAIKLLHPGVSAHGTARLLREARALAQLTHPNVVAVYDADELDGQVFIAMELVDGVTLRDWLRMRERTTDEIVRAFTEAGRGVAAAHALGIVHRDFKPANVMVGDDGRVRVLDFGLARMAGASDAAGAEPGIALEGDVALTHPGVVMGTPAYMAPEQHGAGDANAAADQFALAVSLYEALYGEHPFGGATADELAARTTAGEIRPAPAGATVPAWLRAVLVRGMSPAAQDRYPSVQALLAELTRDRTSRRGATLLAGGAVALGLAAIAVIGVSRQQAAGRAEMDPCAGVATMLDDVWNPTRRAAVAARSENSRAISALHAELDRYAGRWLEQRVQLCRSPDEAYAQRVHCLDAARVGLNTVVTVLTDAPPTTFDQLGPVLDQLTPLRSCEREAGAMRWELAPQDAHAAQERTRIAARAKTALVRRAAEDSAGAKQIADELAAELDSLTDASARAIAARVASHFADTPARSEALLRRAIADSIAQRAEVITVVAYADLIGTLVQQKRYDDALHEADLAEAHLARLASFAATWPGLSEQAALYRGRVANMRGIIARQRGAHAESIPHLRRAVALWEPARDTNPDRIAMGLSNLADALRETGAYSESIAMLDRAIAITEQRADTNLYPHVVMLQNRGSAHLLAGNVEAALSDFTNAYELAGERPIAGNLAYNLAVLHTMREQFDAVPPLLERATAEWVRFGGPDTPLLHIRTVLDCTIARERQHVDDAEQLCNAAIAGLAGAFGAGHPYVASARIELAQTLVDAKRYAAAAREARAGLEIYRHSTGVDTTEAALAHTTLGRALLGTCARDCADANAALVAAIDTFERMKLPDHPGLVAPLLARAGLLNTAGRRDEARALLDRATAIMAAPQAPVSTRDRARARALQAQL